MKKLKRTSYYDKNRSCYLDEEKQEYVYEFISYDDNGKMVQTRQTIAITKDNIELIKMLDAYDHSEDLQNLYQSRVEDKSIHEESENFDYSKFDNIPDRKVDIYKILFDENDENDDTKYDAFLETLSEDQRNLIYDHLNLGKSFGTISKEMGNVSIKGLQSRWQKIRKRAMQFFAKNKDFDKRG